MSIIEYMEQWSGEYFSEIFREEKKINRTYREASQQLAEIADILNRNPTEKIIDDYSDAIYDKFEIESGALYAQGFRDCFALLRFLRLL